MNMTESANPDILVGTETWLKPSIYSSKFMPPGYEPPFRKDRPDGYGRVLVAVKTGLKAEEIPINTDCEMVCVKIKTAVHHPLIVIGAYRPTNSNSEYAANLCTSIKSVAAQFHNSPMWVAGDLNLPTIDWTTDSIKSHQYFKSINNCFIDLASNLGMTQSVSFLTRVDNTLDVFLTNRPSLINRCEPKSGVNDHERAVFIDSNIMPRRQ